MPVSKASSRARVRAATHTAAWATALVYRLSSTVFIEVRDLLLCLDNDQVNRLTRLTYRRNFQRRRFVADSRRQPQPLACLVSALFGENEPS